MFSSSAAVTAVGFDDRATICALLDADGDPNETDSHGFTLLYYSVIANHTDVARLLIERGAKVNSVDRLGMTPAIRRIG